MRTSPLVWSQETIWLPHDVIRFIVGDAAGSIPHANLMDYCRMFEWSIIDFFMAYQSAYNKYPVLLWNVSQTCFGAGRNRTGINKDQGWQNKRVMMCSDLNGLQAQSDTYGPFLGVLGKVSFLYWRQAHTAFPDVKDEGDRQCPNVLI